MKKTKVSVEGIRVETIQFKVVGVTQLVMNNFSKKSREQLLGDHTKTVDDKLKGKQPRAPKDVKALYKESQHYNETGKWVGIPVMAFKGAMIDSCKLEGCDKTVSRKTIDILADGYDEYDGAPLVKITKGTPDMVMHNVRVGMGKPDIRIRARWKVWECLVKIQYDATVFTKDDITKILVRAGHQCGILEGRKSSKNSNGMGWGEFKLASK
jgi:hypothetical protein